MFGLLALLRRYASSHQSARPARVQFIPLTDDPADTFTRARIDDKIVRLEDLSGVYFKLVAQCKKLLAELLPGGAYFNLDSHESAQAFNLNSLTDNLHNHDNSFSIFTNSNNSGKLDKLLINCMLQWRENHIVSLDGGDRIWNKPLVKQWLVKAQQLLSKMAVAMHLSGGSISCSCS